MMGRDEINGIFLIAPATSWENQIDGLMRVQLPWKMLGGAYTSHFLLNARMVGALTSISQPGHSLKFSSADPSRNMEKLMGLGIFDKENQKLLSGNIKLFC